MTFIERFSNYEVKNIDTSGFDELTANEQHLLYHLSMAGNVARNIIYHQTSTYSLAAKEVLKDILVNLPNSEFSANEIVIENKCRSGFDLKSSIAKTLKEVFISNGIYLEGSGYRLRLDPKITKDDFSLVLKSKKLKSSPAQREMAKIAFFGDIPESINSGSLDTPSGFNTHSNKVTLKERKEELDKLAHINKMFFGDKCPSPGINLYLDRAPNGTISHHRFSAKECFSHELSRSVFHFKEALKYTEGRKSMSLSIQKLINFLEQNGDPFAYDVFNEEWVKDSENNIFFAFGFIETYDDVLEQMGSFQSLVGFADPTLTNMLNFITSKAQELENSLPINDRFKRKEAKGVSGSAINLVSFTGDAGPVVALGNVLPNGWVRNKIGSRSSAFTSSISARAVPTPVVCDAFLMPEYQDQEYLTFYYHLLVQLHEAMGHASGQLEKGITCNSLGEYSSIIEECRADLIALYHIGNKNLIQETLSHLCLEDKFDVERLTKVAYAQYLTDGLYYQLTRVQPGEGETIPSRLTTAHFRNRLLNSQKIVDFSLSRGGMSYEQTENSLIKSDKIIINDTDIVREGVAILLHEIQRITSEGDKNAAKALVEEFGTFIPAYNYNSAMRRLESIEVAKFVGFTTPFFFPTGNKEKPYILKQAPSFLEDQLALDELAHTEELPSQVSDW